MSKIKNDGLDQYGAEAFDQQQFGIAGVERVKPFYWFNEVVVVRSVSKPIPQSTDTSNK